jgi:hypothetical protein
MSSLELDGPKEDAIDRPSLAEGKLVAVMDEREIAIDLDVYRISKECF